MKTIRLSFLISVLSSVLFSVSQAQNISGTINTYTNVTAVAGTTVTVGTAAGFAAGDKVMIIQMKGATINTPNNATFGQITAYNNAGNYEFGTIASIAGNQVTLTAALTQTYTVAGSVQLIRVPVYNSAVITAPLTCQAWNGTTGGVLVFEAICDVTFNANIDVTGKGFRGGGIVNSFFNCNDPNYANSFAASAAGQKGEGIAAYPPNLDGNRAPLANGGGGSNQGNPGAGGGSNRGSGGRGGNEFSGQCVTTSFGMGGYPLTPVATKAFMGGGGGGGYRDNGLSCAPGSNGGALVFINTPTISGNGFSINANGANVTVISDSEGAGGGGAGGAVYIWANTVTSNLTINVNGGNGGNINSTLWSNAAHGPGGGGGGGYIWLSGAGPYPFVTGNMNGGSPGLIQHAGPWFNTPYGAAAGTAGAMHFVLPVMSPLPPGSVTLANDTTICPENNIVLDPGPGYASYLWNDGSTNQTLTTTGPGDYWVEVPACGTLVRDTVTISNFSPFLSIGPDQSFCANDSAFFDAGPGNSFAWSTGETTSSVWTNNGGQISVEITDTNGCYATDTAQATVFTLPVVNLGNDTTLCPGFTITFDAGPGYVNYLWQDASTAQTFLANTAGMYGVVVTDTNNCQGADAVQLSYFAPPVANLGPDVSFCSGDSVVLNPGAFSSYAWWNGAGTPTATANSAGWYWVTVTDGNNCTDTDSMQVQNVYANPVVNLGPDTSFCAGESIVLNPGAGYVSYLWQDASVNPTFTTSSQGVYSVTVTDMNNCTGSDAMSVVNVYPLPAFTLGPDFGLCRGDQFQIEPDGPSVPVTYRWRDDSNNSFFNVTDTGRYWLTVTDVNGCTFGDTVEVFLNCPPTLYIPNAFSPNNDPYNPLFQAYGTNIRNFKMEIFNRWGEFVTELNSMTDSWDGTYGSAPAPQGVYVYKVWYMDFESEDVKTLHGRVSLIR